MLSKITWVISRGLLTCRESGLVVDGDLLAKPIDLRFTTTVFCFVGCFIFHKKNWGQKEGCNPDGERNGGHWVER